MPRSRVLAQVSSHCLENARRGGRKGYQSSKEEKLEHPTLIRFFRSSRSKKCRNIRSTKMQTGVLEKTSQEKIRRWKVTEAEDGSTLFPRPSRNISQDESFNTWKEKSKKRKEGETSQTFERAGNRRSSALSRLSGRTCPNHLRTPYHRHGAP